MAEFLTLDGGMYTNSVSAYLEYLREEGASVKAGDLEDTTLEEILESPDAASVVEFDDSTLLRAGEDVVRENADKLAAFGVTSDKVDNIFGTSKEKEPKTEVVSTDDKLSAIKNQNEQAKTNTENIFQSVKTHEGENVTKLDKLSEKLGKQTESAKEGKKSEVAENYDSAKAYTTAGQEIVIEGYDAAQKGAQMNDKAVTLAQQGLIMMAAKDDETKAKGEAIYNESLSLSDESFNTISLGNEMMENSDGLYTESDKFIGQANIFIAKSTPEYETRTGDDEDKKLKVEEAQAQTGSF